MTDKNKAPGGASKSIGGTVKDTDRGITLDNGLKKGAKIDLDYKPDSGKTGR